MDAKNDLVANLTLQYFFVTRYWDDITFLVQNAIYSFFCLHVSETHTDAHTYIHTHDVYISALSPSFSVYPC